MNKKPLRMAVVGMGKRSCHYEQIMFEECLPDARVVAVCDVDPKRREIGQSLYAAVFGDEVLPYDDHERLFDDAEIDGIYIATPNGTHGDVAEAAMRRGIHVLCEKPMEITIERARRMAQTAEQTGCILALAMQMHYRKRYHKVRELITSGIIGEPAMVWCTEHRPPFDLDKPWVWDPAQSGGTIVEKNCHHYDIFDLWVDADPVAVYATAGIAKHHKPGGRPSGIVDHAWIVNDFANGARGMIGISFLAEKQHHREMGVIGTEGRVVFDLTDDETLHVETNNGHTEQIYINEDLRGGVWRDFVDCILEVRKPLVNVNRGIRSLWAPLAAERSINEQRSVRITEVDPEAATSDRLAVA